MTVPRPAMTGALARGLAGPRTAGRVTTAPGCTEPCASGVAGIAARAPDGGGEVRLPLRFPGRRQRAGLAPAAAGQIMTASEADPGHLITRSRGYPVT